MNKIYVYGTLIDETKPREHTIKGSLYDLGWFPGLILDDAHDIVAQLRECTDEELAEFDRYEGHDERNPEGSYFRRIPYLDGFVYVYNHDVDVDRRIVSNDWIEFNSSRKKKEVYSR